MNQEAHERQVRQKLEAFGQAALFELLLTMRGLRLQEVYLLRWPFDVGGQGVLFLAQDSEYPAMNLIVKMPFLPYHRPAYLEPEAILRARTAIEWEAYVLRLFPGSVFPEYYDFFYDVNPLHRREWGKQVVDQEPYLVMEFISGHTLDEYLARRHGARVSDYAGLEILALSIAREVLNLWQILWTQRGYLYTDLRPINIMLVDANDARGAEVWRRRRVASGDVVLPPCRTDTAIRVIDVGSVVPDEPRKTTMKDLPFHPAYAPPEFYETLRTGEPSPPTPAFATYTLGKTLFQVVTNQEPIPGCDPDFATHVLQNYSRPFVAYLRKLITERHTDFSQLREFAEALLLQKGVADLSPKERDMIPEKPLDNVEK